MIPKRVALENFLSFGSPATEIVFGDDEPLWVLGGPNGVGKSAVFDAITYALFGCHRGGGQNAEQLIRHGANGFRVVFEFGFDGADYRITRSRSGRTTQKVERRNAVTGDWDPVANVNSAADVRAWAERTLGLGFDAFTASVLLRQGEADAIITAGGSERLKVLKKIIGAERYEALSGRVHEQTRIHKKAHEDLRGEMDQLTRDGKPPPTQADVQAARVALAEAEEARKAAHEKTTKAAECVKDAEQWASLEGERQKLEGQLRAARERAASAEQVRTDKARLDDLTKVLPVLRQVAALAEELVEAEGGAGWLRRHLSSSPEELALQLAAARDLAKTEAAKAKRVGEVRAEKEGLLRQAKKEQERFAALDVGVPCARCGQPVTAEHAARERRRVADEVTKLGKAVDTARDDEATALGAKQKAEDARDWLGSLVPLVTQLAPAWREQVANLDGAAVAALEEEYDALTRSNVAEVVRKLELDEARCGEWTKRLNEVNEARDAIPPDSRIPVTDAVERAKAAGLAADAADVVRDRAKEQADDLERREAKYRELVGQVAAAEKRAGLHRKLDELLGRDGLQRELVRTAEQEIVRLANGTVQSLSDGDLTIELDGAAEGGDEAFALRVRRADNPAPIGVDFLSGSQKFRVAIAVALAIGRFAAGQARPLDCVIIDEGFGSLDRDGLRAAADELNRLRQHLRRIVLVSHQEEFADRFPVVIRLTAGESGTTAEAVRR